MSSMHLKSAPRSIVPILILIALAALKFGGIDRVKSWFGIEAPADQSGIVTPLRPSTLRFDLEPDLGLNQVLERSERLRRASMLAGGALRLVSAEDLKLYRDRYVPQGFLDPGRGLEAALAAGPDDRRQLRDSAAAAEKLLLSGQDLHALEDFGAGRLKALLDELLRALGDVGGEVDLKIVADDSINAFTFGGGRIYLSSGLIAKADDAELAFVLAHELSHVLAAHSARRSHSLAIARAAEMPAGELELLAQLDSRIMEAEADTLAIFLLQRAGKPRTDYAKLFGDLREGEALEQNALRAAATSARGELEKLEREIRELDDRFRSDRSNQVFERLADARTKLSVLRPQVETMNAELERAALASVQSHPDPADREALCRRVRAVVDEQTLSFHPWQLRRFKEGGGDLADALLDYVVDALRRAGRI